MQEALPPDQAEVLSLYYNIYPDGEMHHNPAKNVLYVDMEPKAIAERMEIDEDEVLSRLDRGRKALLEARGRRPMPFLDRTIYANWNGMMASTYLEAYKVLGIEACKSFALRTIDRLLKEAYEPARP